MTSLKTWIDQRWPLTALARLALDEEMAGGSGYAYVFGSATLIVFLLQALTGIWQVLYYVPTLHNAYISLGYLRTQVPFGWLIHGLHYWGAQVMIVLMLLHLSQVFIWGAYKKPHELKWITGVLLLIATMGTSLTGGALPWDKRSYWLVQVAGNTVGTIPFLGSFVKRIMLGGDTIGQLMLSRFFIEHIAILPGILVVLASVHLIALRKVGAAGPWSEERRKRTGPFWPDQVFKDGLIGALVLFILVGLAAFQPQSFEGMADPQDSTYIPKPEWNFLFYYQALKYFPGSLEPVVTLGIPVVGVLFLLAIPFFDRRAVRNPRHRPLAMAGFTLVMGGFLVLTYLGSTSGPIEGPDGSVGQAASSPSPPPGAKSQPDRQPQLANSGISLEEQAGARLFQTQGCTGCHKIQGKGGTEGPDLSLEGTKGRTPDWLRAQLRNPRSHFPATVMPSFSRLSDDELNRLVSYLLSLVEGVNAQAEPQNKAPTAAPTSARQRMETGQTDGGAASILGSALHGRLLFTQNCQQCHGVDGAGNIPNPGSDVGKVPALDPIDRALVASEPEVFAENIDRFIQHGSTPEGHNASLRMLAFGDDNSLTQPQIADLEAYIIGLNGRDRAEIIHPGMKPHLFFNCVLAVFAAAWLLLGGYWIWNS